MREILFRGKNESGKWVEGYYVRAVWYLDEQVTDCIFPIGTTLYPHCEHSGFESIVPETVGQYTGLTDKNGTKIFEGDILKANNGHIGWVIFRNGEFVKRCCCHPNSFNTIFYGDNETVVGNIYDNPELLEGKGA